MKDKKAMQCWPFLFYFGLYYNESGLSIFKGGR